MPRTTNYPNPIAYPVCLTHMVQLVGTYYFMLTARAAAFGQWPVHGTQLQKRQPVQSADVGHKGEHSPLVPAGPGPSVSGSLEQPGTCPMTAGSPAVFTLPIGEASLECRPWESCLVA